MNLLKTFDPSILLGDRLGFTLYIMFVEAYLKGEYSKEEKLYEKFISKFASETKTHKPNIFIELINRIKNNGFNPYYPVYANPDEYTLLQGSHRCSIAIGLGIKDVPYCLRFKDSRIDDSFFKEVFAPQDFKFLKQKQEEFINRCDPLIALKCRIRSIMRNNIDSFQASFSSHTKIPALRLYQGFEKLAISGKRPAQKRVDIYELQRYLNRSMHVLGVGCNVGFLELAIADYVQNIDGFDVDQNYIEIANMVKKYCNIENCNFFVDSVDSFVPKSQYDLVISAAVHGWSDMSFGEYISIIAKLIKTGGLLLFESHEIDVHREWPGKKKFLVSCFELLDEGYIDDADENMYQSELREFLLLRKKSDVNYEDSKISGFIIHQVKNDTIIKRVSFFSRWIIFGFSKSIVKRIISRIMELFRKQIR